jgi:type II secretory pathway predicted ATPase ExeA
MHLASNAFLDDISLLFNFYMDSENPYILCLIGLPHLIDRLRLMQFQPLEQRIVIRHRALLPEEAAPYIEHHLKLAGASASIFKPSAIEAIAAKSSCLPRVINNIATHALIYGAANNLKDIDEEAVFKACEELSL